MMPLEAALSSSLPALLGLGLSELGVVGLDGGTDTLDSGLQLGTDGLVAHASLLGGDDALLLRLDVSHVQILSISLL